jgi:hypothetical protein
MDDASTFASHQSNYLWTCLVAFPLADDVSSNMNLLFKK